MHNLMLKQIQVAQDIKILFRSIELVQIDESMKAHVRSTEICVEGMAEWVGDIRELC